MKRMVAAVALFALLLNCTYTLPHYHEFDRGNRIVISDGVGDAMDLLEVKRYGLFPLVEDFQSAIFYEIEGGGYEVTILTEDRVFTAVNRDPRALDILRDHIDNHEAFRDSMEAYEEKWSIVDYDVLGFAITKTEIDANTDPRASLGCALGSGLLFGVALLGVSILIELSNLELDLTPGVQQDDDSGDAWIIVPAICLGIVAGVGTYIRHRENDREIALKKIQQERKPRIVESVEIDDAW